MMTDRLSQRMPPRKSPAVSFFVGAEDHSHLDDWFSYRKTMESESFFTCDEYPDSALLLSQPRSLDMVNKTHLGSQYLNEPDQSYTNPPFDQSLSILSNAAAGGCDSAAKLLPADAMKNQASPHLPYLTPDYSGAHSPSIASEGMSSPFFDSILPRCSMMSPERDHGDNMPRQSSTTQDPSHMDTQTVKFCISMTNTGGIPHHLQTHSRPQESCHNMQQPDLNHMFGRMQYPDHQTYPLHSIVGAHGTSSDGSCSNQGPFQQLQYVQPPPFMTGVPSYHAQGGPLQTSPSKPGDQHSGGHHQHRVSSHHHTGASSRKPCQKSPAKEATRKPQDAARPGGLRCLFAFAGCDRECKGKNEWKRHVNTKHLLSRLYVCPDCPQKEFNRKDLFTQHYIRMHISKKDKEGAGAARGAKSKTWPELEEMLRAKQAQAERGGETAVQTCRPEVPRCLLDGCGVGFPNGDDDDDDEAWERCLDHVSKHLVAMATGKEVARGYDFTRDQLAYFQTLGAIAKDDHGCWVLGAQSNGERTRQNKKKLGQCQPPPDVVVTLRSTSIEQVCPRGGNHE
ncbi:hypothetical protein C2857_002720 [Epichloe festucae Fl1]|uniref:C2H2-type domain-containing protein n=1 Tax=Epichloe festucae (strain Fl1) TaxID=877507 RepID=A0A7S9KUJ8_EPIFF|nr:hypothetical protein C2857_002720 [Epichloe festucae Fl1]